jgi:hypothetical protein
MFGAKVTRTKLNDRAALQALDKAVRRWAFQAGAYVRKVMQSSIKDSDKPSRPGQPPHSHTGILRRFIRFAVIAQEEKVIIGPKKLPSKVGQQPRVLEFGGVSETKGKGGRDVQGRFTKSVRKTSQRAARPFARPALLKSIPRTRSMWRDSIKA